MTSLDAADKLFRRLLRERLPVFRVSGNTGDTLEGREVYMNNGTLPLEWPTNYVRVFEDNEDVVYTVYQWDGNKDIGRFSLVRITSSENEAVRLSREILNQSVAFL